MKKIVCLIIMLLVLCSFNVVSASADTNLALSCDYTISHPPQYPDSGGELTDGGYGEVNFYDSRWTGISGVKNGCVDITIDLGENKDFNNVVINLLDSRNYGGIYYSASDFVVSYSDSLDGEYCHFASGRVPVTIEGNSVYNLSIVGATVNARFIKIEFEARSWVFISEIEVYNKGYMTLSTGKKYYSVPSSQATSNPDDYECQLTDGIRGDVSDNSDPAWVYIKSGYLKEEKHMGSKTVIQGYVIDLGSEMYVTDVSATFISTGFGGTSEYPWTVWTYATNETDDTLPENWFMLSRHWDLGKAWHGGTYKYGWRSGFTERSKLNKFDAISGYSAVKTRYIRVDIEAKGTAAIDEIVVNGYAYPVENAFEVTEGRNLDTGRDYLTADELGVSDMALCYNGYYGTTRGYWTPELFKPYLTYVDANGNAVDTMFDTICFLGINGPTGVYNKDVANKTEAMDASDWIWYLDKTFDETSGDTLALAQAAEIAANELNDPDYKVKLVVMHPGADGMNGTQFGPLDGKYYDVTFDSVHGTDYHNYPAVKKGWQLASDWWFDEVIRRFESGKGKGLYDRVELIGFYYLSEQIGYVPAAPRYHIDRAHELGYKIFSIPFNFANGYHWGDDMPFDGVAIQPNHFFADPLEDGGLSELGNDYLDTVAFSANYTNVGIEMEFDDRVYKDPLRYNLWLDYLNGAYKNKMDGDNSYRAWYQAVDALYRCSVSDNPIHRSVYDYSYQLMQGTYTPKGYIETFDDTIGYTVSGTAPEGVRIELLKDGEAVNSAFSDGSFMLCDVDSGDYTVKVSASGYATREYEITVNGDMVLDTEIWLYGDANGDGAVNAQDVLQINRKIVNMTSVFSQTENADYRRKVVNVTEFTTKDDLINAADVLQINRKIANMSSVFDSKIP